MLRPKSKVVDIKTRKPVRIKVAVDRDTILDVLDALEQSLEELDLHPDNRIDAENTILEMKFCACFNPEFRRDIYPDLEELLYELYERVHI